MEPEALCMLCKYSAAELCASLRDDGSYCSCAHNQTEGLKESARAPWPGMRVTGCMWLSGPADFESHRS